MNYQVSIVIPTYNRYDKLVKTLSSLRNQTYNAFEVIVADDGSSDQTAKIQEMKFPFLIKYYYQENSGRAAARNLGIKHASGKIIIFVDDHIILDDNFVKEHWDWHQRYQAEGVVVVRGKVCYIKDEAELRQKKIDPVDLKKYKAPYNENSPFYSFITNNISVSRQALELVGGFDPDFTEYGFQDQELGYRLRSRGYKFKINPNALGYIFSVNTPTAKRLDKHRQAGRSAVLFYRKHFWGGLQIGVNFFNLLLNKIFSFNDNWLARFYTQKIKRYEGKNKTKFDKYFYKLRQLYFLQGLNEGFAKYPKNIYQQRSGAKVIMLVSHQSNLAGAPISLTILAKGLLQYGYQPIFVVPENGPILQRFDDTEIITLNLNKYFRSWKLKYYLKKYRPVLLHANTFLSEYAVNVAKKLAIPTVIHIREDLEIYPSIAHRLYNKADRLIVISQSMLKDYPDKSKIDIVYNAVDYLPAPQGLNLREQQHQLLFIGTIERRKGLSELLEALALLAKKFPDVHLDIIGKPLVTEKKYLRQIKKIIRKYRLENKLNFLGSIANIEDNLDITSVVVVPSLAEPFGRVVIEAMARKKIVIGANVGGIPEIIQHNHNGFLTPAGDPKKLAESIVAVWQLPEASKQIIKENGYQNVKNRFLVRNYVEGVLKCYRRLGIK